MGGLLAAIGNNEAKANLLLRMKPHTIYTASELHQLMMSGQDQQFGWRMHHSIPFKYCKYTLAPIGLVAQEVLTEGDLQTVGYIKTDYGEEVGSPMAGLLLDYSRNHPDVSLLQLFAATKSSSKSEDSQAKKRAPMTRLKIFRELVTASLPMREEDLITVILGNRSSVGEHLRRLNGTGIIDYESTRQGQSFTFYKLSPSHPLDQPPQYKDKPSLTTFVYQAFIENPDKQWTLEELAQLYLQTRSENQNRINFKFLKSTLSNICSHLLGNGYAERGEFSAAEQSNINLSPKQRQNLVDLVTLMDVFQRQDPQILEKGSKMAQYFKDHPEEVAKLMAKAQENSPSANQQPQEETAALINGILTLRPGLTRNELQNLLMQHGRNLSTTSIRKITNEFHFPFTIKKGVKRFSPHPISPNEDSNSKAAA